MSSSDLKRRLAAILAADVAGYSRLMAADDRATVAALDVARAVFRGRIEANQGRVIDMAGDSVLAVFETATGAVSAALTIQSELAALIVEAAEDRRMRFRIGIHLGDVIEKVDGTIYGDGVNIAARLEGLAEPGGITVSDSVRIAVKGKVSAGFEDQGEQQVKNIPDPVHAYRVGDASSPAYAQRPAMEQARLSLPDKPSIAVLPFANMSGDPEQEYFADGMVEDIITELSRFRALLVIARNSTFTYKGMSVDVKRVAQELGVHFVLEGSVRKAGNRVRITAQLINGETGHHVWAERYEDVMSDVFELQERITRQVVSSMVVEIETEEMRLLDRGWRRYAEADDIALRANKAITDSVSQGLPELALKAIELAEQSIEKNRSCQRAWYVLSVSNTYRLFMTWARDRAAVLADARRASDMLMQLAPNDSRSCMQRAMVESMAGEFAASTANLRRAHAMNPNDAIVLFFLSQAEASGGNVESAKSLAAQALRMSPRDQWVGAAYLACAMCAFIEGDLPALYEQAALAIQTQPNQPMRRVLMIAYAQQAGDAALLRMQTEKLQSLAPNFIAGVLRGDFRFFYRPEHMQMLLDCLQKADLAGPVATALR